MMFKNIFLIVIGIILLLLNISIHFDSPGGKSYFMNEMLIKEELSKTKNTRKHEIKYENKHFKLENFNYKGKCSNPFKYKQNNKRDLLFNTLYYNDINQWNKDKEEIKEAIELSHNTILNVTKIVYIYDNVFYLQ